MRYLSIGCSQSKRPKAYVAGDLRLILDALYFLDLCIHDGPVWTYISKGFPPHAVFMTACQVWSTGAFWARASEEKAHIGGGLTQPQVLKLRSEPSAAFPAWLTYIVWVEDTLAFTLHIGVKTNKYAVVQQLRPLLYSARSTAWIGAHKPPSRPHQITWLHSETSGPEPLLQLLSKPPAQSLTS